MFLNILRGVIFMRVTTKNYCCFTGLRPQKLNFKEDSKKHNIIMSRCEKYIIQLIEGYNVTNFISGMALGWDIWCAEEILKLRDRYSNISLECAVPCSEQDKYWSESDKRRYTEILSRADKVVQLQEKYTSDCMIKRNRYMVDKSLYVFALWDKQNGGTANTIKYALEKERRIIIINPVTAEVLVNKQ